MQASRNPAKSRPLSANVKRLMRLARASPQNNKVIKFARTFTARDLAYCHKQGVLFMEAASMGFSMSDLFYRAVSFLNEERSLIIITNRELSGWISTAEDTHLMQTLVDRITANSQIIRL